MTMNGEARMTMNGEAHMTMNGGDRGGDRMTMNDRVRTKGPYDHEWRGPYDHEWRGPYDHEWRGPYPDDAPLNEPSELASTCHRE